VSDHSNGDIVVYDISASPVVELGRIVTNSPGIMGIKIGPDGRIWAVNATTHALIVIDPDGFSVGLEERDNSDVLKAYPNPATNEVVIVLDRYTAGSARMDILDAAGRLARSERMTSNQLRLDVSSMNAGSYLLRVTLESGEQLQQRLMITR